MNSPEQITRGNLSGTLPRGAIHDQVSRIMEAATEPDVGPDIMRRSRLIALHREADFFARHHVIVHEGNIVRPEQVQQGEQ